MKRSELPLYKELEKTEKAVLKKIACRHGWRQRDFIEWRIEAGYFLCLSVPTINYVLSSITLEIKPLFIDDLWWDVFNMSSNKNEPKSLRGIGIFAVKAPKIAEYDVLDYDHALDYSQASIESKLEDVFQAIDKDIQAFLSKHPNPELFCPKDGGEYGRIDPIYTLTMDLHAGKFDQVEERIRDYRSRGISSGLLSMDSSRKTRDAFDFFIDWCHSHSV